MRISNLDTRDDPDNRNTTNNRNSTNSRDTTNRGDAMQTAATMESTTIETPTGPLTVVATGTGAVRAAGFGTDADQMLPGIAVRSRPDLGAISKAVQAYLDGDLTAIDEIPVEQPGGGFLSGAWHALRDTRPGETLTYTAFAARIGRPAAVRAAANACARNTAALFVPCHRVLRLDGGLGGYRWGLDVKRWLLRHEQG